VVDSQKRSELVQLLRHVLETLSEEEQQDVLSAVKKSDGVPISAFSSGLSSLEIVVRVMRDSRHQSFKEIARILNRKLPTVYTTYQKAHKKHRQPLDVSDRSILIPFSLFHDRTYSILEAIVAYLKEKEGLTVVRIAALLHRDYNTIQTVARRHAMKTTRRGGDS
jgi:hypothetical protein